ncbi:uncharacterized protein C8R40DRAFT_1110594 [Lentinula edodes]|uniref:uncharacterized protein n=1 Tax=Lentinula edodes TaxID=5353 RepID=UPI001E8D8C44|nr:uncharacterized protein C8R40DRAFT_1110594 [Lentinula edodes]KAH7873961.1 hypothetical protein C8R40DRAFT_1110594 [Lentinula edodes]
MRFNAIVWISLAIFTIFGTIVDAAPTTPDGRDGFWIGDTFVHNIGYPDASKNLVIVFYNGGVGQSGKDLITKLLRKMFEERLKKKIEPGWTESRIAALKIEFSNAVPSYGGAGRLKIRSGMITFSIIGNFGNCYNRGCRGMVDDAGEGHIFFGNNEEIFYSSPHNKFMAKI